MTRPTPDETEDELVKRVAQQPFPTEDAKPGEPDYLDEHQMEVDWKRLQRSISEIRLTKRWRGVAAVTIPLLLSSNVSWIWANRWTASLARSAPTVIADVAILFPSAACTPLKPAPSATLLSLSVFGDYAQSFDSYRVSFARAGVKDEEFVGSVSRQGAKPSGSGHTAMTAVMVTVPRTFWTPGEAYEIRLYGVRSQLVERLASYHVCIDGAR